MRGVDGVVFDTLLAMWRLARLPLKTSFVGECVRFRGKMSQVLLYVNFLLTGRTSGYRGPDYLFILCGSGVYYCEPAGMHYQSTESREE
jgi:hypothetical protein